jgi:hypothetical protein
MDNKTNIINGQDLWEMFAAATNWLEKSAPDIDAMNVFPVPDGDTGTNMLLTMRSTIDGIDKVRNHDISSVAQAMARGALMGARGNSGVILSQFWNGLAKGLAEKETCNGSDLADALTQASLMAYKGLSNPVEGTILTVIKDVAVAAQMQVASGSEGIVSIVEATVDAANESVANTPALLGALKEAGVVDAGGQGLYTILEGALYYLKGETEQVQFRKPQMIASNILLTSSAITTPERLSVDEIPFGYCTEFMLKGENLELDKLRKKLAKKGESLIVVGDDTMIRIHIHTLDPGNVIHYATSLGTMHNMSIRNMDEQRLDFLEIQRGKTPTTGIAVIAVVAGTGLTDIFKSLGTAIVVPGGQTMNPSTKDLLQAVEQATSDKVIILPNNKNIVPAAEQTQSLTDKKIKVVPTETIPQGVAALLAFDYEADFETNGRLMTEVISLIKTIEITKAVRSAKINGLNIKKKQVIGLLDGNLIAAGNKNVDVFNDVLSKVNLDKAEVVTIYYGVDTKEVEAQQISTSISEVHHNLQIEIVKGDQPHYNYIISIE